VNFDDPVLRKELSGLARRWQTYLVRVLYVGLIGIIVYRFWVEFTGIGVAVGASDYGELGRKLFYTFVTLQMIFITVATAVSTTDALTREIRLGTLGLLVITPLSGWRIASGKWKASMAHAFALVLAGLPVLSISVYLGGVGPLEVAWGSALTLGLAAVSSGFSLLHVATFPTRHNALVGALFTVFLYVLAPTAFAIMGAPGMTLAAFLSPPHAAIAAAIAHQEPAWAEWYRWAWTGATATSFLTAWRLIQASAGHLARWTPEGSALVPAFAPPPPPARPAREVPEQHPLLWKELALREAAWGGRDRKAYLLTGLAALVCLCWLPVQGREMGPFVFLGVVFTLLAVMNGSSLFLHEREARAWDPILSTPIPRARIVRSKLLAGLVADESRIVLGLGLLCVAGWSYRAGIGGFLTLLPVAALFLLFSYLLGAAAAFRARTMRGAFMLAGGGVALILFVLPWLTETYLPSGEASLATLVGKALSPGTFVEIFDREEALRTRLSGVLPSLLLYMLAYGSASAALYAFLVRGVNRMTSGPS
jgi:ABC-type transport system involved in multi-copper enzyme maturation permease subunit